MRGIVTTGFIFIFFTLITCALREPFAVGSTDKESILPKSSQIPFAMFPFILIIALLSTLIMVSSRDMSYKGLKDEKLKYESIGPLTKDNAIVTFHSLRRRYKFFNHCSEKQMMVVGNAVTAQGPPDSPNANLILQSAHYKNQYGVHIIGERSGRFICFNKKSKLISRFTGTNPRCLFVEEFSPDHMYTVLKSVYNPNWCVGFNRKGKPIPGSDNKTHHRSRCFYFTKRDHSYLENLHKHNGGPVFNPNHLAHLLDRPVQRKRHNPTQNSLEDL